MELRRSDSVWPARQLWLVLFIGVLVAIALLPTMQVLFERWSRFDESYGHAILLWPIFLWVVWDRRYQFATAAIKPAPLFLLPLLGALAVWLLGRLLDIVIFQQLMWPIIWGSAVGFVLGRRIAMVAAFPLLLLYSIVPIWDQLTPLLVESAVIVVSKLLSVTSIPAYIEGNRFELPSGIVSVADGCSGSRYLIIGVTFGVLAAGLYFRRWRWRLAIIAVTVPLALLTNWIRIYLLVLIGYFSEMQSSLMGDHELFGFVLFGFVFAPLYWLIQRFSDQSAPRAQPALGGRCFGCWPAWLVLVALLAAPALLMQLFSARLSSAPVAIRVTLPQWLPGQRPAVEQLFKHAAEAEQRLSFHSGDYYLGVLSYRASKVGQDFVPYRWMIDRQNWFTARQVVMPEGEGDFVLREVRPVYSSDSWLIAYRLEVGGRVTHNAHKAKLLELPALLNGRNDAAVIYLAVQCPYQGCASAQPALLDKARSLLDQVRVEPMSMRKG